MQVPTKEWQRSDDAQARNFPGFTARALLQIRRLRTGLKLNPRLLPRTRHQRRSPLAAPAATLALPDPFRGRLVAVERISHITFIVRDLERTSTLLKTVLNAEEVYASGNDTFSLSRERFFLIGGVWIAIMEGPALSDRSYNHVAFKIAEQDFDLYRTRLQAAGVDVRESRSRIAGEGRPLYFYDHDNHLFELHTGTLQ